MRDWYQLANEEADPNTRQYTDEGKERLAEADEAWQRYLEADKKPEPSLASLMVQVYGPAALEQAGRGGRGGRDRGRRPTRTPRPTCSSSQYAALAGQDRKADLAGKKAIELAPKEQRSSGQALVEQAKQPRRLDDDAAR